MKKKFLKIKKTNKIESIKQSLVSEKNKNKQHEKKVSNINLDDNYTCIVQKRNVIDLE